MEQREDRIIKKFDAGRIAAQSRMPLICIYEHPADYPQRYVARLWDIETPTNIIATADTLEEVRETIPHGMVRLKRSENDDPCIVETWI